MEIKARGRPAETRLRATISKCLSYCEQKDWAGYEPYDVLNSRIFATLPFFDFRLPRLALTQAFKRSPINLRRFVLVPKTQNPKAIGLFLSAFVELSGHGIADGKDYAGMMVDRLGKLRSKSKQYWCWGYNFPWQTRTVLVPRWEPNLVCTAFAATGLLDLFEQRHEARCLEMAVSAADFILDRLYWSDGRSNAGFGYPLPTVRNQVYNANLLAAALFSRVHYLTGEKRFIDPALRVTRSCVEKQQPDGSWWYGEASSQRWIDNFHTGFNLSALHEIGKYAKTAEFEPSLHRGFEFYRERFFREDGAVRYFHDRTYPIDTHCVAQSIITLIDLADLDPDYLRRAQSVFDWAMGHMWDQRGFFYYRILRWCTIRTEYMRWTQAWMFLALAKLLAQSEKHGVREPAELAESKA